MSFGDNDFYEMLRRTVPGCGDSRRRPDECRGYEGYGRFRFEPCSDGGYGHFIFEPDEGDFGGCGQGRRRRETFSGFGLRDPNPCCDDNRIGPPPGCGCGDGDGLGGGSTSWIWILILILLSQQNAK